jgi:hypothetical protein
LGVSIYGGGVGKVSKCPFLSNVEETITCFTECAFYEYVGTEEGCPFKSVKGEKNFIFKDILQFDFDKEDVEEDLLEDSFIKDYI